jgi:hypothetical protein
VRLRGHLQQRGDDEPAVLLLVEWMDEVVDDAELSAADAEAEAREAPATSDTPADLHGTGWGHLAWDEARDRWCAEIDWDGHTVTLSLDASRVRDPQPLRAAANALFEARADWQSTVRSVVEDAVFALYDQVWRDADGPLDAPAFAARLQPYAIDVGPEGQLDFWFHDDGLFGEHDIRLSGQLDRPELTHSLVG